MVSCGNTVFVCLIYFLTYLCLLQMLKKMVHFKCRNNKYPFSEIRRIIFSDAQVPWDAAFDDYNPEEYNSPVLKNKPWADPDINDGNFNPKWNTLDGKVNRLSHNGAYSIAENRPLNPMGRTGLKGRGVLGRWGPNHAADPIVTRWKRNATDKHLNPQTNLPVLQFCAIQRHDCDEWAIPGGMVDPGEKVSETLKREFLEEAMNALENPAQAEEDKQVVREFFKTGREIYKGYVDDPRNTDNAWMETVAFNFHDETGSSVGKFSLKAGDDARSVRWMDVDRNLALYASHVDFIKSVAELRHSHW